MLVVSFLPPSIFILSVVFSPWPQNCLWEGRRKVNIIYYTLERWRKGASQRQNLDETQEKWGRTCARISHRGAVLCRKAVLAACLLPDTRQDDFVQAPSSASGLWERQDRRQSGSPPLSCTPVLTAVPVCKAGRGYTDWLHRNIARFLFPLSSSLSPHFLCLC